MFGAGRLRGLPPGQAGLRPAQPAQSRQGRRRPADDRATCATAPAIAPPSRRRVFDYGKQEGFVRVDRAVQRHRRLPQAAGRDDVPVVPGHARREGQHARPGQRPAAGASARRASRCAGHAAADWVHDVLDLCLMCKACKAECPSNVDMAKLKAEFLHAYYERHAAAARPPPDGQHPPAQPARRAARAAGQLARQEPAGRAGCWRRPPASTAAAACRRCTPTTSAAGSQRHKPDAERRHGAAACCCWTTASRPSTSRRSARRRCACWSGPATRVELAGPDLLRPAADLARASCGEARDLVAAQLPALAQRVADGTPILGLEPSCLLTLADEWPELVPGPTRAASPRPPTWPTAGSPSRSRPAAVALPLEPTCRAACVLHGHCHQKALRRRRRHRRRRCGWFPGWT